MLIDWFTVGAQALNFLVLVWLLKHFLYKPILKGIDTREKLIAAKLAGAETKMAEATTERDDFRHKNEELDRHRAESLSAIQKETAAERVRLLDEAKKAADALAAKRLASIKEDIQNMNIAIGQRLQKQVFTVARHALKDMSTSTLEASVVDLFLRHVRELADDRKHLLIEALQKASEPATVRSAFELSEEQRAAMQQTLNVALSADIRITYAVAPDIISGIEFVTNGQKISWSIADYVTSLEDSVDDVVKKPTEGAHAHGS